MVIPPAGSSLSNCFTAGEISLLPGTIIAHSKFPELAPDDLPVAEMGGYCGSNLNAGPVSNECERNFPIRQ
jgi:hypothetical protein